MRFDWRALADARRLDYVEGGPGTAKGNIYIACPFCPDGADKRYMGLHLASGAWGCWKSRSHVGQRPQRLLVALLRIPWTTANEIVNEGNDSPGEETWEGLLALLEGGDQEGNLLQPTKLPSAFESALDLPDVRRYLTVRGFEPNDHEAMIETYWLLGARSGKWRRRLILPLTMEGEVYGWTGRATTSSAKLRYLTAPDGKTAGSLLFNLDEAMEGGEVLVITEGPLDALKVDWYGYEHGIRAVGILGLHVTSFKLDLLLTVSERYDRVVISLDRGAEAQALDLRERLGSLHPDLILDLPASDPGELEPTEVRRVFAAP